MIAFEVEDRLLRGLLYVSWIQQAKNRTYPYLVLGLGEVRAISGVIWERSQPTTYQQLQPCTTGNGRSNCTVDYVDNLLMQASLAQLEGGATFWKLSEQIDHGEPRSPIQFSKAERPNL